MELYCILAEISDIILKKCSVMQRFSSKHGFIILCVVNWYASTVYIIYIMTVNS